ncbi:MAG: helix-turn-helix transcriptional regulator [Halobacteriota archaeon]
MRCLPCIIALLALFALSGGVVALDASPASQVADSASVEAIGPSEDAVGSLLATDGSSETELTIQLEPDRNATWTVTVTYDLDTEHEVAAFEDVAAAFEAGDPDVGPQVSVFENFAALASEQTGREMTIESISRSSSVNGTEGSLTLTFVWTDFLDAADDRLLLDDVFELGEDDRWLRSLGDNQRLRIHAPEGYSIVRSTVSFEEKTVVQEGPYRFDREDHISMAFEPETGAPTEPPVSTPNSSVFDSWGLVFFGVVIAVSIVSGALLLRRRGTSLSTLTGEERPDRSNSSPPADSEAGSSTGVDEVASNPDADRTDPDADRTDPDADRPDPADPGAEDLSLLSDEERVERMLEAAGGRMRQAAIVSETGWSDAKVSQLLSSMAEAGRVEKLRLGRENLISLPDESPASDLDGRHDADESSDSEST